MAGPPPVLVSVPHGGIEAPPEALSLCLLDERDFAIDGDTWARELYDLREDVLGYVDTPIPRAIVDMNRSPYGGPGPDAITKTVTVQGKQVWQDPSRPPRSLAYQLVSSHHWKYHQTLDRLSRKLSGVQFGLDCHTMLAVGPEMAPDTGRRRPMICISNRGDENARSKSEPTTAPAELVLRFRDALAAEFSSENLAPEDISINAPFRGGYICRRHGQYGPLPWLQLELSRALYLPVDGEIAARPDRESEQRLDDLRRKILGALRRLFA